MKRNLFSKTADTLSALDREIAIMKKLDHPNIVKLWEVIDDPKEEKLYLVMDLVKKGAVMSKGYWKHEAKEDLDKSALNASIFDTSFVTDGKKVLIEEKALKYFRELILGLDYLHNYAGVIHRDIKPENLLIDEYDSLKISDFGVSLIMEDNSDELKNNAGTKLFLPPESFGGKSYKGKPADIWAAGATLFYFLTGKPPFPATVQSDLMNKVMNEEPVYPESMSKKIQDVIKGCLQKDPDQRSTIQDIMKSDWLTEDGQYTLKNMYEDDDEFKLSEQEIVIALTKLKYRAIVKLKAYFKQHLNRTRDKIERRKSLLLSQPAENQTNANTVRQNQATQSRVNLLKALQ